MSKLNFLFAFLIALIISFTVKAQEEKLIDPELTEIWEPQPEIVTPGNENEPPSDAIVLFDGSSLDKWEGTEGGAAKWTVENGAMTVKPNSGSIKTKQKFTDIQLHIEWRSPEKVEGESQGRGNSGIFFQERYELQVLDNYNNKTYINGQAGSIYKQHPPLVNACRPPGKWQTYDVVFIAPRFSEKGMLVSPGRITVFQNGVLVQHYSEIKGNTVYRGVPKYNEHGAASLMLQDHHNPVSYRNIWVREL